MVCAYIAYPCLPVNIFMTSSSSSSFSQRALCQLHLRILGATSETSSTALELKQNRTEPNRTEQGKAAKREEWDELGWRPKIVTTCKANYYQGRRRIGTELWALLPDGHVNVVMLHVSWLNAFHKITFNGFQLTKCIVGTKILVRGSSCFTEFTVKTLSLVQRVVKFYQSLPWSYLRVVLHVHISCLCLALGHTKFLTITQNNGICS